MSQLVESLRPLLQRFENERQEISAIRSKQVATGFVIFAVAVVIALLMFANSPAPAFFIFIAGAMIAFFVGSMGKDKKEAFIANYKQQVFGAIAQTLCPGIQYLPYQALHENYYLHAGLTSDHYDRYSGEDFFSGTVGETAICFSELHVEVERTRTDSEGRRETYWDTVFRGILFVADFHKNFSYDVLIEPDYAESTFGWLGRKMQNLTGDVVRLENPEFEKTFKVTASDSVESRYLLTPDMQSRFLSLHHAWQNPISARLSGSCLYLALPSDENWFEMNFSASAFAQENIEAFHSQLSFMLDIVSRLNLNTRIWTKE